MAQHPKWRRPPRKHAAAAALLAVNRIHQGNENVQWYIKRRHTHHWAIMARGTTGYATGRFQTLNNKRYCGVSYPSLLYVTPLGTSCSANFSKGIYRI